MNLPEGYKFKNEDFQILKTIGHGGQCTVYLAKNEKDENFAVKQLMVSHDDPLIKEQINMFKREYELLSVLEHPVLPKGYKYFQEEGEHFIVVEYVSGKNMDEILHTLNRPFSEEAVIEIALQISELLLYLSSFEKPVILRDIKPSNMIITPEGEVKFIDFSIAREFNAKDDTVRLGSPGYAPPEQYRGHSDTKSDIYALGITMYELLTMKDPSLEKKDFFTTKTVNTKYQKLNEIVENLTKLKPEERYEPEELNGILEKLYKKKDKSELKKLSDYIYNVPDRVDLPLQKYTAQSAVPGKMVNFSIREKLDSNLFLKFSIEETDKSVFSCLEIFFVVIFLFITMCIISIKISPVVGMIYFFTVPVWVPKVITYIGISTYKYRITDEYIEIKGSLFRKSLFGNTRIYWNEIKSFEKRKFENNKKDEYILKSDEKEIMVFPQIYPDKDTENVKEIISF
ncbi:MAG: serine/threonine-protein kinase, partial [Candidatus Eremiobacterota bacterium]